MVILEKMTLWNTVLRNMQVQDSYGSSQQLTQVAKLWELKFLEYLYPQVLILHTVATGFHIRGEIPNKSFFKFRLKKQRYSPILPTTF